jgi:acyl carrier protein
MLTGLEQFIFRNFKRMPPGVRVFTYLFLLILFAYLTVVPRFVNGQLVIASGNGGSRPYRGGELAMHVDGRVFKFRANEDGYWSVPVISLLPHTVRVHVYLVDSDEWYPVDFSWLDQWTHDAFRLAVTANPPGVGVVSARASAGPSQIRVALARAVRWLVPDAAAGVLQVPPDARASAEELSRVQREVVKTVSQVTGRDAGDITPGFPLVGASAPSYVQRIEIVGRLERTFSVRIPDEHWNFLLNVGELVDYLQKRVAYRSPAGEPTQRPVFKR